MTFLVIIIILALIFDYINGFHDAANSIATIVSTKVLTPFQAVVWAAIFNFVAFFIAKYWVGGFGVANTIAKSVHEEYINLSVIFAGLLAAIFWNLLTWWFGIPSSSSHTLIGGFAGAAVAYGGFSVVNQGIVLKTVSFIFLAPVVGMIIAFIISLWFIHSFKKGWIPKIIAFTVFAAVALFLYKNMEFDPEKLKKTHYESYFLKVIFYSKNFVIDIAIHQLIFSFLEVQVIISILRRIIGLIRRNF